MSDRQNLVYHGIGLCLWGLSAVGVAVSAAGPTGIAIISMILFDKYCRGDKARARRAVKQAAAALDSDHEGNQRGVTAALQLLKDHRRDITFDVQKLKEASARQGFPDTLYHTIFDGVPVPAQDDVEGILKTILAAAYEELRKEDDFHKIYTQESLKEIERLVIGAASGNAAILAEIDRMSEDLAVLLAEITRLGDAQAAADAKTHAMLQELLTRTGGFGAAMRNSDALSLDDLVALARQFGDAPGGGRATLVEFLTNKAEEYRSYRAEIEAIDDRALGLSALKAAALAAAERLDFDAVEARLADVQAAELDIAADTAELRARNALLRGRVEQAHRLVSAAADSFAAIDPLEPARRRLRYSEALYAHGLRYGWAGLALSATMIRAALAEVDEFTAPTLWAQAQTKLGNALQDQGGRTGGAEGTELLAEAVNAYCDALTLRTRTDHPVDWAHTQNNLGNALARQGSRTDGAEGTALLAEAVAAYRFALSIRTRADHPVDWAQTQNNLGIALQDQGSRTGGTEGTDLLADAATAYRHALSIRTRADLPVDWATTQNNLGNALAQLGIRSGGANGSALLAEAVAAYHSALTIRTRDDHPLDWAQTQSNLGNALAQQGSGTGGAEGTGLQAQAVAAYRCALTIRTRADNPVDWAQTQNNLGSALGQQGSRTGGAEGTALLAEAAAAYHDALTIRTRDDHPVQWAMTQENLAFTEEAIADHPTTADPRPHLAAALAHLQAALEVYDPEHLPFYHEKATAMRNRIAARLAAAPRPPSDPAAAGRR